MVISKKIVLPQILGGGPVNPPTRPPGIYGPELALTIDDKARPGNDP